MKQTEFRVVFTTGIAVDVSAFSDREAIILAQAEQIRKGNDYEVQEVRIIRELREYGCGICDVYRWA